MSSNVSNQSELENFPSLEWYGHRSSHRVRTRVSRSNKFWKRWTAHRSPANSACCSRMPKATICSACSWRRTLCARELVGNIVTYVVNRNINFTNICFVGCKFCAFSRGPRESDTYFLEPRTGRAEGCRSLGRLARLKFASRAVFRMGFLRFIIATFCAQ